MAKTKYIKDKHGKFKGSIGSGKSSIPTSQRLTQTMPTVQTASTNNSPISVMSERFNSLSASRKADELQLQRFELASDPNTPKEVLMALALAWEEKTCIAASENESMPPEGLHLLAQHEYYAVRKGVARNKNTSPKTLSYLANDEDDSVLISVARNTNTPSEALERVSTSDNNLVQFHVMKNSSTPIATVEYMKSSGKGQVEPLQSKPRRPLRPGNTFIHEYM